MKMGRSTVIDGTILHCHSVRVFAQGAGNLKLRILGLPDEDGNSLEYRPPDIPMTNTQKRSQTVLSNFRQENFSLEVRLEGLGDYFIIDNIVLFTRPTETGYPQ